MSRLPRRVTTRTIAGDVCAASIVDKHGEQMGLEQGVPGRQHLLAEQPRDKQRALLEIVGGELQPLDKPSMAAVASTAYFRRGDEAEVRGEIGGEVDGDVQLAHGFQRLEERSEEVAVLLANLVRWERYALRKIMVLFGAGEDLGPR